MTSVRVCRAVWVPGASLLVLFALAGACGGTAKSLPAVGSESHFLDHCESTCAGGLDCIGGICTRACLTSSSDCSDLAAGASCTDQSVEPGEVAVCDLRCTELGDCGRLGTGHSCERGFCRKGAPLQPTRAPAPSESSPAPGESLALTDEELCQPYLDQSPPPDERGFSIVNEGDRVLYLEQLFPCGGVNSPSLVQVRRDGQLVNTFGGGCGLSCQAAFEGAGSLPDDEGYPSTECPGADCAVVPRFPIQPGETLFQRAGREVVFHRMPRACAIRVAGERLRPPGSVPDIVHCYSNTIPARGNYVLTVRAYSEPDCQGITNCQLAGSCESCPAPLVVSVPSEWYFENQTIRIPAPD